MIKGLLTGFSSLLVHINVWANKVYLETDRNIDSIAVPTGILHIQIWKLALWTNTEKVWFYQNAPKTSFTFNINILHYAKIYGIKFII